MVEPKEKTKDTVSSVYIDYIWLVETKNRS